MVGERPPTPPPRITPGAPRKDGAGAQPRGGGHGTAPPHHRQDRDTTTHAPAHLHTPTATLYSPTVGTPSGYERTPGPRRRSPRLRGIGGTVMRRPGADDHNVSAGPARTTRTHTTHHDHITHRHHTLAPRRRRSQTRRTRSRPRVLPDLPHPTHLGHRPTTILGRSRPHHPAQPRRTRRPRQRPDPLPPLQPAQRQRPLPAPAPAQKKIAPPKGFHRPGSVVE